MFETHICVIGNVLTAPEWRRTSNSGRLVASFKVAAGTRRLDRATGNWVDGNGLRVRVSCWRDLAGGVASSIMVGDPVIVYGQIYTRDWVDSDGTKRTLYEMEALAVGHNLARGRARFARNKPVSASEVEPDPTQPIRLGGEPTEPAPEQRVGMNPGDPLQQLDDAAFNGETGFEDPSYDPFKDLDAGIAAPPAGGFGLDRSGFGVFGPGRDEGGWGAGLDQTAAFPRLDTDSAESDAEDGNSLNEDDEDTVDEERADDAEAAEHRPEGDDEEVDQATSAQAKTRRRRRTPAGV
jgi:single-strand DNA-binding protein